MSGKLGRTALMAAILILIAMQVAGFARVARTANLGIVDEAQGVVDAGRVAGSVLMQVTGRQLNRLVASATARAAVATARVAVQALDAKDGADGTPGLRGKGCKATPCNARVRVVHLRRLTTT